MIAIPFVAPLSDANAYLPSGVGVTANGDPGSARFCRVGLIGCAEARDGALSSALTAKTAMSAAARIFMTDNGRLLQSSSVFQ